MDQNTLVYRRGESSSPYVTPIPNLAAEPPFEHTAPAHQPLPKKKGLGYLWGLGGSLLSVAGFVAMMLFEQYNGMLAELRNDLKHFNETSGLYVKRESLHRLRDQMRDCTKEMQACNLARAQGEQELRASERARSEMAAELQRMRERLSYLEGRQAALTGSAASAKAPVK